MVHINESIGTSLAVQWLRFLVASVGGGVEWGMGSIPDQGAKMPQAMRHHQKINKQNYRQNKMKALM